MVQINITKTDLVTLICHYEPLESHKEYCDYDGAWTFTWHFNQVKLFKLPESKLTEIYNELR